jgi:hypothetical protein
MYDSSLPPVPLVPPPLETQKQSKLGIAAFILGIVAVVVFCIGFLIAVGYGVSIGLNNPYGDPYSMIDQGSTLILVASGFIYCSPVLSLVGVGLGIAAVAQKKGKKTLGIIGLVLNGLILLSFCALLVLGLMMV